MGIPSILPMRKPDPRFISLATFSLAQDMDGSGEGEPRYAFLNPQCVTPTTIVFLLDPRNPLYFN